MRKIIIIVIGLLVLSLIGCFNKDNKKVVVDYPDSDQEINHFIHDTILDSVYITRQRVVYKTPNQVKQQIADLTNVVKSLKLRIKDLEYINISASEIKDSVKAEVSDSCISYNDEWISLRFNLGDSLIRYKFKDSITTFINPIYKHRFLWWRWGIKGYEVGLQTHNPHSSITYNQFIKVQK